MHSGGGINGWQRALWASTQTVDVNLDDFQSAPSLLVKEARAAEAGKSLSALNKPGNMTKGY